MRTCSYSLCQRQFEPRILPNGKPDPKQRYCWYGPCRDRKLGRKPRVKRQSTTEAGYGYEFQKTRRRWAPLVDRGEVYCHSPDCGKLILPGTPWDLGHDPVTREIRGPEHARCNRSEGAKRGNRQRIQRYTSSAPRIAR